MSNNLKINLLILSYNFLIQWGAVFEGDEKLKAEKKKKVEEETIPNNLVWKDRFLFGTINFSH